MRELILDDMLPRALAAELAGRGRPAHSAADLGLAGASDAGVLAAAAERDAVLVTTIEPGGGRDGATVAVIAARPGAARREAVHRHAHAIAAQPRGSLRRYPR